MAAQRSESIRRLAVFPHSNASVSGADPNHCHAGAVTRIGACRDQASSTGWCQFASGPRWRYQLASTRVRCSAGPNRIVSGGPRPARARLASAELQSLGHLKESQLVVGSSRAAAPRVLSTPASFPYHVSMTQRSPGNSATHHSESLSKSSTRIASSTVVGAPGFNASGYPRPNRVVAADRNPRERGLRPLNNHR